MTNAHNRSDKTISVTTVITITRSHYTDLDKVDSGATRFTSSARSSANDQDDDTHRNVHSRLGSIRRYLPYSIVGSYLRIGGMTGLAAHLSNRHGSSAASGSSDGPALTGISSAQVGVLAYKAEMTTNATARLHSPRLDGDRARLKHRDMAPVWCQKSWYCRISERR
jgi:hypothetical protein